MIDLSVHLTWFYYILFWQNYRVYCVSGEAIVVLFIIQTLFFISSCCFTYKSKAQFIHKNRETTNIMSKLYEIILSLKENFLASGNFVFPVMFILTERKFMNYVCLQFIVSESAWSRDWENHSHRLHLMLSLLEWVLRSLYS